MEIHCWGGGDITISGGGDYLPLTGGTLTGDLTLTSGIGGFGNFLAYTSVVSECFSDIYYLSRSGDSIAIRWQSGNKKIEIIDPIERPQATIDWSGDGTKFLSDDGTYKTISGGGSSSGESGAYSEVNHGTSDTTFTLTPNTFHVWDEISSLTLTLGAETSGVANEYLFQFTSGSEPTTLSLPDDIKWTGGETPTIAENMIYQISILKGLGSVLEFDNALSLIENKATLTYDTITFQYPVASELTIKVGMETVTISVGEKSYQVKFPEPGMEIMSISPISDSTYYYTF